MEPVGVEPHRYDRRLGPSRALCGLLQPGDGSVLDVVRHAVDPAQLARQLGGTHPVVGELIDHRVVFERLMGLHPGGDARMRASPVGLGEGRVSDLANQIGAERPLLARLVADQHEQLFGDERVEHRSNVVDPVVLECEQLDRLDRTAPAQHGAVVEHLALDGRQAVEARRDQATQGVGQLDLGRSVADHSSLGEQRDQLLEEERVATAAVEQSGRELVAQVGAGQ